MAEDKPPMSLHIDTDWKKQAQEEKRRLAEQEQQRKAPAAPAAPAAPTAGVGMMPGLEEEVAAPAARSGRGGTQPASFASLVQSMMTQVLFYLGELAPRGGEPMLNLDMAKQLLDTLGVLEEKTKNNLTPEEQKLLDAALYETRTRYINVASQFIGP